MGQRENQERLQLDGSHKLNSPIVLHSIVIALLDELYKSFASASEQSLVILCN